MHHHGEHSAYIAQLAAELEDQAADEQMLVDQLDTVDLAAVEVLLARTAPGQESPTS